MKKNSFEKLVFAWVLFLFLVIEAGAQVSHAYQIDRDSISGFSGPSSSSSYNLWGVGGQTSSGSSSGTSNSINAGSLQSSGTYVNIDVSYPSGTEVEMSGVSGLISGQSGFGYADVNVTTDYDGYTLDIKASTSPAMKCLVASGCEEGDSFADYVPAGGIGAPDYTWSILDSASEFGFTAKGDDIVSRFMYDTGSSSCGSGATSFIGDYCWDGLTTSSSNHIAESESLNHPNGVVTRVKFKTQVGLNKIQPSGDYKATVTFTAIANQ